ncbi:hypothetical protein AB0G67_46815 [Streptomyces sp. NPDC021056]|uniref:hypothetical protein n=1 Tax=Streptomyces sp. NPDC021056 TaxID=3155012 RepID=UPI0034085B72
MAEPAANAVTHCRVPGRDFELRLALVTGSVPSRSPTPARNWGRPPPAPYACLTPLADCGRGLERVEAFADRWEVLDREPPAKTVRAGVDLPIHRIL